MNCSSYNNSFNCSLDYKCSWCPGILQHNVLKIINVMKNKIAIHQIMKYVV